jgi:hypothetical protein
VRVIGEVQAVKEAESNLHSKETAVSFDVKVKMASVELEGWGGWVVMVVFGAVLSTLQV